MRSFFSLCLVVCAFCTLALGAELEILEGGDVMKVSSYEIRGQSHLLDLASGGRVSLPTSRVSRLLADENSNSNGRPVFLLRFDESHAIPQSPYGELIHAASRRHRLNPELVRAIVRCESAYDPNATSPRGARGLLQLMPATASRFGITPEDLTNPEKNLEAGVRYLSWLTDRFDEDLDRVLAAFNSGEGTVARYQGVPPYRETHQYLQRVYADLGLERDDV